VRVERHAEPELHLPPSGITPLDAPPVIVVPGRRAGRGYSLRSEAYSSAHPGARPGGCASESMMSIAFDAGGPLNPESQLSLR